MTIYSLYIFDRHCECVYFQSWHRTTPIRLVKDVLPGIAPDTSLASATHTEQLNQAGTSIPSATRIQGGKNEPATKPVPRALDAPPARRGLPFDEESKLIFGVIYSLRNMVKKLSPKEDEAFISYKTSTYKIHLFETPSGMKFVLFSDPLVESLRFVLKSIYQTAFIEFVVRNPMIVMDSRVSGKGIDNQAFRTAVHNFVSGLSVYR